MRTLFLLLVFANAVFFAWRYFLEHRTMRADDPVAQQIAPERVKILAPEDLARIASSRKQGVCVELGPLAPGDAGRAEEAVNALAAGLKVARRKVDEPVRWWVYVPPLATRAAALQRVAELKSQGVEDSSLVTDDSAWRNAVSLGIFRSEEAATRRLDEVRKRGVRGAEVGAREGAATRVYVQLRDGPEPVRARLREVREGFPGAEIRECP